MTAAQLDQSLVAPVDIDPAALPRGPKMVYNRALAAGFRVVSIRRGTAVVDKGVREYLFEEDGSPMLTEKGGHRYTIAEQIPTIVPSIALRLQHDEHEQGQAGWWVDGKVVGWVWPSDGSDIRRTIGAAQLGTLVDLAALAGQSLTAARALDAAAQQLCHCFDCKARPRHLEMT